LDITVRSFRSRGQCRNLGKPPRQHMAERRAFGVAHLLQPFERLRKAFDDPGLSGLTLALLLFGLGHVDHALERQDAVERRRRGIDLAAQALKGSQHRREHRLVDARDRRYAFAADRKVREHRAARQHLGGTAAHRHFDRVPAGRQAQLEVESFGVDRLDLPRPGIGAGGAVASREAGHARQRHRGPNPFRKISRKLRA
jgi:hypothetical protein